MIVRYLCNLTFVEFYTSILIFIASFHTFAEPAWLQYKNEQGVSVYYQKNHDNTFIVKGELSISNATARDFLELLSDTSVASNWIENVSQVRVIDVLSPSENLVYSFFNLPWPMANRDAVTYSCYKMLSSEQSKLTIEARPNELPLIKNTLRIHTLKAHWLLTQEKNNLKIVYQVYALPGGIIPTWLNNQVGLKSTLKTLINLRRILVSKRYKAIEPVIEAGGCN